MSAKEIAEIACISYSVVNNYTDMGLLDVAVRKRRVRFYDFKKTRSRLAMISKMLDDGYTLRTIVKSL